MNSKGALLLLAGTGALLLLSGRKKGKRRSRPKPAAAPTVARDEGADDLDEDEIFKTSEEEVEGVEEKVESEPEPVQEYDDDSAAAVLARHMDPEGRAQLGMLYQIRPGDTPLEICREALFGSRDAVLDAAMWQAAKDLLVRIDCGPWNQALSGIPLSELNEGHAEIDSYFTQRGVSFDPIYQDNMERILNGLRPTAARGYKFALIWIPMINPDHLDLQGVVTTEGMYHPDTQEGMGGSMIDPPQEILDLEFEEVSAEEVGCDLPEGDYRRMVVATA